VQAPRRLTVVLADDHVVVRRGLRALLEAEPGIEVVAETADADAAPAAAVAAGADVLILDLNMPGRPLEALARVAERDTTAVLVLTMERDPEIARHTLALGARGFLSKHAAGDELVTAIRAVAEGSVFVGAEIATPPAAGSEPGRAADELTARETEVLRLIALGHTNPEIATALAISVRTVETHRNRVREKLGASSRSELVRFALERRLI